MSTPGFILILFGILTMLGAALNWRIVTRTGKLLNLIFGDTVARIVYFAVGIFLFIRGVEILIGSNWF
ncbi:MAG: hypothetical protein KDD72_06565 [Anaerolineales bacterium]|nr:hypothetical protein [Anaerolineales bacterium]